MKNYLSYRWPEGGPEDRKSERFWQLWRSRVKQSRVLHIALVGILLAALCVGVAAAGWFLTRTMLRSMVADIVGYEYDEQPEYSQQTSESIPPELALPRADVGLGVSLELDDTLTVSLSAQEIYNLVLPSVVSITAESDEGTGTASGIIMREDGYILTNYHVIEQTSTIQVMLLESNETYSAELVGCDSDLDLAVLKIDANGLTAARFGDSDTLQVGDAAYAIGNPLGYLYGTMTDGIISYTDRLQTIGDSQMDLIQTTAVLNAGNSGGALVNERGQVVGITVAKISSPANSYSAQTEGLGFAIPISAARPYINHILDTGESWRPTMGIQCYEGTVDGVSGVLVESLTDGGPAMEAGFQEMDLIIAANGRVVSSMGNLKRVLGDAGVGGTVSFTVLRDSKEITLTLVLVEGSELEVS